MSKIRINDLARELEVKSKSILDVLPEIGVTEKKSHSSSLEDHEAEKVRIHLRAASQAQTSSRSSRPGRAEADEIKTKIDLSHISKPGDAL
jgi:translation initiation factor IF-2